MNTPRYRARLISDRFLNMAGPTLSPSAKRAFPGCVIMGEKVRFIYLMLAGEHNFFNTIFTQPGKNLLVQPFISIRRQVVYLYEEPRGRRLSVVPELGEGRRGTQEEAERQMTSIAPHSDSV